MNQVINMNKNIILCGILLVAALLMVHPVFRFSEPIVQTDGISYYVPAKVFSETFDFHAKNPSWNIPLSYGLVQEIKDYPPGTFVLLGIFLRIFGHDYIWLNGLYGAVLLVFHLVFLYLLIKRITKSENWSLFGTVLGAINIRLYFLFYAGMFPTALGICLTTPALYFFWKYFESFERKDLVLGIIFTALLGFSYPQQTWLFSVMILALGVGYLLETKLSITWPKIKWSIKEITYNCKFLLPVITVFIVSALLFVKYGILSRVTSSFTSDFFHAMLYSYESAYPKLWSMPILMDGPLIVILFFLGLVTLFYLQSFRLLLMSIATGAVVLFGKWYLPDIWVRVYFYRYFAELSIVFIIVTVYLLSKWWERTEMRKEVLAISGILIVYSLAVSLAFFSFITPAISSNEMQAAHAVYDLPAGRVFYYNNVPEEASFRSFYWVIAIAQKDQFTLSNEQLNTEGYDVIFVANGNELTQEEQNSLTDWTEKSFGEVSVFLK